MNFKNYVHLTIFLVLFFSSCVKAEQNKWDKTSTEITKLLDSAYNLSIEESYKSIEVAQNAYEISIQSKNPHNVISSLIIIASLNQGIGNTAKAFEKLNLAKNLADSIHSDYWVGTVDLKLGEINRAATNYDLAREFLHSGKLILNKIGYIPGVIKADNRLAAVFFELLANNINNHLHSTESTIFKDSILYYGNKSLAESEKNKLPEIELSSYEILASYYLLMKDYQNAKNYLVQSEKLAKQFSPIDLPLIYSNLSYLFLLIKDLKNSLKYGLESNKLANKSGIKVYRKLSAEQLVEVYRSLGDYKSALSYADSVKNLILELYNKKIYIQMYLLDNQQKLLQQKAIITAEKEKNKLQIFVFSFILFILIVSFIVLINNRRKTIKYNNKLKLLNQEINTKNDELDSALKSKDKFFSIIAHDLRNPFGSFMMLTKYLKEELQNLSLNEIQEYLTILSSSSDNLFKLLENLLEWSRVQRDLIEPHFGEFNVKQVVKMCVSFVEQQAQAKSQEISYDINEEITGFADSNLINTIIRNLLTNAIKFTPRGGKITIEALEKEDKVIVSVADTGTGMDSNTINKLFKIEEKIGTPGTEGEPSTGLGLVLCKEFIELNKGKIYVQSKLGEGSTFFIEFPKSK